MTKRTGIICAGNWIVDIIHEIEQWPREGNLVRIRKQSKDIGGGAANVISVLVKLDAGFSLWPIGAVGDDEFGQFTLNRCHEMGLSTEYFSVHPDIVTAHTHVMSVIGKSRTFFYQGASNDVLGLNDFPAELFKHNPAKIFYLGYLTLLQSLDEITEDNDTVAAKVLSNAKNAGLITCVDLVSILETNFAKIVEYTIPYIDYLVINEIEAAQATKRTLLPEGEIYSDELLAKMGQELIEKGVQKAVIIHSSEQTLWIDTKGSKVFMKPTLLPKSDLVSPLGAGDAFCAGLMVAIHYEWKPESCLALANDTAKASLRGVTACDAIPNLKDIKQRNGDPYYRVSRRLT